jgi:phytoene dehydrogenase-like protein
MTYDAAIVGSGPNGLAAGITLAQAGKSVLVLEGRDTIGGGTRTAELTLPGFKHDVCSALHPLGVASPFFRELPLAQYGLEWIAPPASLAHPLDDGSAVMLEGTVAQTAANLGPDAAAYRRLMGPLVRGWQALLDDVLGPLRFPSHPLLMARFGLSALLPAATLARTAIRGEHTRAMFAGMAAHAMLPLTAPATAAIGLMLGLVAHGVGWPMPRGGSQRFADALGAHLESLGGEIRTGSSVRSMDDLPEARAILFDTSPRGMVGIAGERLPAGYRDSLSRYRYGPGVFKLDYALDAPVPWTAEECFRAGTVHLGGTLEEITESEAAVWRGEHAERPYVIVAQHSLFDDTRAPEGKHTLWAYCHVPNGSTEDMTGRVEAQIERFAPGFRDRVLAVSTMDTSQMEAYNPNYVGGDINTGVQDLRQFFTRPVVSVDPYSTPAPGLYLCSSSTPPGGGVHGMCGYYAARSALRWLR